MSQQTVDVITLNKDHSATPAWDGIQGARLPAGDYNLRIVSAALAPSKKGDSNNLTIRVEVVDGQHTGITFQEVYNIAEDRSASIGRLRQLMQAAQIPWDNKIDAGRMVGTEFIGAVSVEESLSVDARTGASVPRANNRLSNERPSATWRRPAAGVQEPTRRKG